MLWIEDSFKQKQWFEIKKCIDGFGQIFSSQDFNSLESCGLLVDFCDVFNELFGLSFWRHPFTAKDPLVSKRCNAKFLQICILLISELSVLFP